MTKKGNSLLKRRKLDRWEQDQIWKAQDDWIARYE
jgi:hypothetical protein